MAHRPDEKEFYDELHKERLACEDKDAREEISGSDGALESVASPLWGFDISNHQGLFPLGRARKEGFTFALFKASQGNYFKDAYYHNNEALAKTHGLIYGAYHFLEHGDIKGQVDLFLDMVGNPDGKLIAVDVEAGGYHGNPNVHDVWNFVTQLAGRIGEGHPIIVYSGAWYWKGYIGDPDIHSLIEKYGVVLWDSHYVVASGYASQIYRYVPASWWSNPCWGGARPTILQYSASGVVCGRSNIDVNAFAGSRDDLLALTGKKQAKPQKFDLKKYTLIYDEREDWAKERADWLFEKLGGKKLAYRCSDKGRALYASRQALASKKVGSVVCIAVGKGSLDLLDPAARANISNKYRGYGHAGRDVSDIWDATNDLGMENSLRCLEQREKIAHLLDDYRKEFKA